MKWQSNSWMDAYTVYIKYLRVFGYVITSCVCFMGVGVPSRAFFWCDLLSTTLWLVDFSVQHNGSFSFSLQIMLLNLVILKICWNNVACGFNKRIYYQLTTSEFTTCLSLRFVTHNGRKIVILLLELLHIISSPISSLHSSGWGKL